MSLIRSLDRELRSFGFPSLSTTLSPFSNPFSMPEWSPSTSTFERALVPAMDVSETPNSLSISTELPGVPKENVKISIEGDELLISGQHEEEKKEEDRNWRRRERSYGKFERRLLLPSDINQDDIKAHMENGILKITLGKKQQRQKEPPAKTITVQ